EQPAQNDQSPARISDLIAGARQQAELARKSEDRASRIAAARAVLGGQWPNWGSSGRESPLQTSVGMPASQDTSAWPAELLDRYEITGEAHRGGQSVVYAAVQKSTGRRIAIKIMREGPLARREDALRFEREVQILAQLDHANIVGIIDSGVSRGLFY